MKTMLMVTGYLKGIVMMMEMNYYLKTLTVTVMMMDCYLKTSKETEMETQN